MNSNLPNGTVTFLFTDIEGSTKLAQKYPDAMPVLLARHNEILNQTIAANNGYVFRVTGDSYSVAFHNAHDAVCAGMQAQESFHNEAWSPAPIKVRMGVHTGTAELESDSKENNYSGYATLALTQRIMAAGHGGQILVSQSTYELIRDQPPGNAEFVDMGERRLKDILRLERLYQLSIGGMPAEFPPLQTLDSFPNNLPVQLTSFVGRERELANTKAKLDTARLLTLIGPGGTGKTRLSLQLAANQFDQFKDGVWLAELAPISDPAFIVSTIADVFELREAPGVPLIMLVIDYLRAKEVLLVLDNCEHLVEASARVVDQLLRGCVKLKIIASSREALGIDGETVYRVPSLSLPEQASNDLMKYEATNLFIERATKAEPRFQATRENAAAIIQICQRLDGIPLAIELAAARIKLFTPEQIAERLDDRFKLLSGGSRTALPRQQTLHALIDWSYHTLNQIEQRALRRLAVFSGGWTIEGAEAVVREDDALDGLLGLVNKSLINVDEQAGAARYRFLETIRQYAMEKLLESDEATEARNRHLDYVMNLTGKADLGMFASVQLAWLDKMEMEHDNLRAALEWSSSQDIPKAVQLALSLGNFWNSRDYNGEAVAWSQTILRTSESLQELAVPRAMLYGVLAQNAIFSGNQKLARTASSTGAVLAKQAKDKKTLCHLCSLSGIASMYLGDLPAALQFCEDGEVLARELGLTSELGNLMVLHAQVIFFASGDSAKPKAMLAEVESLILDTSSNPMNITMWFVFGRLTGILGNIEKARALFELCEEAAQKMGNSRISNSSHSELAHILRKHGEIDEALGLYMEVLPKWKELGHRAAVAHEIECIAFILIQKGQPEPAVTLLAAAETLRTAIDSTMTTPERAEYDRIISGLHTQVDENKFKQLRETGHAMDMDQAIKYALEAASAAHLLGTTS